MAKLTPKQEKFCNEYIKGGSASDAYRAAYDCARMKPETINRSACSLLKNHKITTRLHKILDAAAEAAKVTLVGHLNDLKALRDEAREAGKYASAVQAEIARGKASGLYPEKHEFSGPDGGAIQTDTKIVVKFVNPEESNGN